MLPAAPAHMHATMLKRHACVYPVLMQAQIKFDKPLGEWDRPLTVLMDMHA